MLSIFRPTSKKHKSPKKQAKRSFVFEQLEIRDVLSTFNVLNLNDSGAGSLRKAILDANSHAGADVINFNVAGKIKLTSGALASITDQVDVRGNSAPGFTTAPVVQINFNGFDGLKFGLNSAGSALRSLSMGNAAGIGVLVKGSNILVAGNYIGLALDGSTVVSNGSHGLEINTANNAIVDSNVISGNKGAGVSLSAANVNLLSNNLIGTNSAGTLNRGNAKNGIVVSAGSMGNTIGGALIDGNVISGNKSNGVYLTGGSTETTLSGNLIGTNAAGNAVIGNVLDGVKIEKSTKNLIGHSDPVTGVTYYDALDVPTQPVSGWQGIRNGDTNNHYLISGTSDDFGLLFDGFISGVGTSYTFSYPGSQTTSAYGPDNLAGSTIRLVGSYKNSDYATAPVEVNGFLFEGTTADFGTAGNYRTIDFAGAKFNYVHSTMGGLAVGNYDSPPDHGTGGLPLGPGHAFLYDINADDFLADVVFPGSTSNTAYGIWYNGGTSYTICGGYSDDAVNNFNDQDQPIGQAYLVDYDSATEEFTHWKTFAYPNGTNFVTHFQGISSVEKGVYTLSADSVQADSSNPVQGSWASVRRNDDGTFGDATWVDLNYTGVDPTLNVTSANSVYGNQLVGIVIGPAAQSYQATVDIAFRLSNVISGNGGNGVGIYGGANDNQVAMNYIGTDILGTQDLGNAQSGVLMTSGAARNLVGGEATGGNNPTNNVFVRPPQGNLISGNNAYGVYITGGATQNQLSGNFIGTTETGDAALGNALDGVAIVNANNNSLLGCTFQEDPFVFYNVISGNGGNGLRVANSNNTTIQANFFGMGADNDTAVGNALNGVLVGGSSAHTTLGGPIPLGNVVAANGQNGVVVQGTSSYFISYNTFCGLAAFKDDPIYGNGLDGFLITATGGNILLRTNVITRNGDDGVDISGSATDVRVTGDINGLNTNGLLPMGNLDNGVEISGNAHNIFIGGPQPTFNLVPQNTISGNQGNGVAIFGNANHITVNNSFIGTDVFGAQARPNHESGVYIGPGAYSNVIGSTDSTLPTVISGNSGNGVELNGTQGNTVSGVLIGVGSNGTSALGNGGNGVYITNSKNNLIGRLPSGSLAPANIIGFSGAAGVYVQSGNRNGILGNSIYGNTTVGINLGAGANKDQAAPLLASVTSVPLGTQITGTLTSTPKATFTVQFFANDSGAASGRFLLGSLAVKTNAAGVAAFNFLGQTAPLGSNHVTATATDVNNNTSEFSASTPLVT